MEFGIGNAECGRGKDKGKKLKKMETEKL